MRKQEKTQDALIALILMTPALFLSAFTTMKLWNWFIADTFNLIQLSMWQAYGIDLLVSYLTYRKLPKDKDEKSYQTTLNVIEGAFITGFFLLLGFIFKQFI